MKIKITADSTCDLSPELISKNNITLARLAVIKDGKSFRDGLEITPGDIFKHVAAGGALLATSAVNIQEYIDLFAPFSKEYDAVVHINIGSGFSSCHQNARIAAQEFQNVYVIDSRNLSTGQGHVVMEACRMAEGCNDIETMLKELRELANRVETSFLLERLDYMVKGGRCSGVMALGANLLSLKPCIEVVEGKMRVGKKYRGSYTRCLERYVKDRLSERKDIIWGRVFVTHTPVAQSDVATVKAAVAKYGKFTDIIETEAGCTVSCHCGEGTLGILYIRKKAE